MRRPSVSRPPQVFYPAFEEDEGVPDGAAVTAAVQALVDLVWGRLPEPAGAVIALDLEDVWLLHEPGGFTCGFDTNSVLLNVGDYAPTPQWEVSAIWRLAYGFAYAFLWSMVARMAGADPPRGATPAAREGAPGATWWRAMAFADGERNPYARMTVRMADALLVAWGFGEEMAADLDPADLREPYAAADPFLGPELGKVYWRLRQRLGHVGTP
jgi:hypothetical protein